MAASSRVLPPPAMTAVDAGRPPHRQRRRHLPLGLWITLIVATLYFLVPLLATVQFSLDSGQGFSLDPYLAFLTGRELSGDFYRTISYSILLALLTVAGSLALIFPTAYWVNLRLNRFRPVMTFTTFLPFVIPPVILSLALQQTWSGLPPINVALVGTPGFLIGAYVVLSFPYMYGSIDNGLRAMDIHTLTEAAQSLGATLPMTLWRVILPNLWPAVVSGALLTFSIVMGEFVLASLFNYFTFPIFLNYTGQNKAHVAAALTIVSFAITWFCLGVIQALSRRAPGAGPTIGK
ncbi:MAG TPA: ABC transporter permease subunit [Candidatus Limnocylindrales bacterium]|nr:ABC transporter permease subunit [Candidatus Limnocylindrales bacterium]